MASSAYDQSIRNSLVSKGIDNSKIGYNNGYVTVDGQNFQKADKNYNGSAYTNVNNFNSAWNTYSQGLNKTPSAPAAPAVPAAPSGMVGVRDSLHSSGYAPNSIGYQNGMVTVNNQPFITPSANVGGSAYSSPSAFNSALGSFRVNDLTNQVVNNTKLPTNTYTPQIDQTIQQLMDFAKNQQPVDPYSTPEYAAFQAQADRRSNQGIRAAQEAMGSAGFGRSTALGERAQSIQNDQTEYLNTQVIPQIIAANEAKKQQEYNNLLSVLTPLMSQQGYTDTRSQTERGNLMSALDVLTKQQQQGIDNTRNARNDNLNAANVISQLTGKVVSPQTDWTGLLRQASNDKTPLTLAGQNQQFNQSMDVKKFNEDVKNKGLDYAIQQAQLKISRQNANTSSSSTNNSIANNSFNQLMDIWKATGKAPAGLPDVPVGTIYSDSAAAKAKPAVYEDIQSNIEKISERDSSGKPKNPDAVEAYIKNSNLSNYEKYRAWVSSGLEWPDDVEVPTPGE